jgi:hypothetical protein
MKKTSTIKKAQMGAAMPAKKGALSGSMKKFKPTGPKSSKGPVYEGSTLPEYTVKAPKAKTGTSLGMKSVKSGYDNNPKVTRADIISAGKMKAGKAMYGTKVVGKKPIKKAQTGTTQSMELPEFEVTASKLNPMEKKKGRNYRPASNRIGKQMAKSQYGKGPYGRKKYQDGGDATKETSQFMELPEANVTASRIKDKPSKAAKPQKNYTRDLIRRSNKMNKNQFGFSRMNPRKRFEDGGEVSMAKKGASVKKKSMGKCKMGC